MKKLSMLLLFSAMVFGLFANGQTEKQKENDELYEILWYNIGTPQKDTEKVFEELNKYTSEKIGATVKMVQFDWGEYTERMKVIIASGEPYDIGFTCSWANSYTSNVYKGAFLPLDELLESHGQGILDVVNPSFFEGITINNSVFAVPANKELGWWEVFLFNEDIVNKYDFDISNVHSVEDLKPFLEIVKAGEGADFTPIMADKTSGFDVSEYAWVIDGRQPFVVDFDNSDYRVKNLYETPEKMSTLKTLHNYYENGYYRQDVGTLNNSEELRKSKKWFVAKQHYQPYADKLLGTSWGTPLVYSSSYTPQADNSSTQGSMQAISITTGNAEKSMAFLNLLNTDPYVRNLVGFGIEDVHWETTEEGRMKMLPVSKTYQVPNFTLQNLFITNLFESDPSDKWVKFEEFNDSCIPSPMLGFQADLDPIRAELSAISNINEEFHNFLENGVVDPEEYIPKYMSRLNDAGQDLVITELQRQVDAWVKQKK